VVRASSGLRSDIAVMLAWWSTTRPLPMMDLADVTIRWYRCDCRRTETSEARTSFPEACAISRCNATSSSIPNSPRSIRAACSLTSCSILRMRSSVALPAASEGQFIGGCDVDAN